MREKSWLWWWEFISDEERGEKRGREEEGEVGGGADEEGNGGRLYPNGGPPLRLQAQERPALGLWLIEVTVDTYKVPDPPHNNGRTNLLIYYKIKELPCSAGDSFIRLWSTQCPVKLVYGFLQPMPNVASRVGYQLRTSSLYAGQYETGIQTIFIAYEEDMEKVLLAMKKGILGY